MDGMLDDLIHLADPPGTSGHVVALRLLRQPTPGDRFVECEFVVATETVGGRFPVLVSSFDLDEWGQVLDTLAANRFASWLNSGRSVQLRLKPLALGVIGVSLEDAPSSQVTVSLPMSPPADWIDNHRRRLERVRQAFPA